MCGLVQIAAEPSAQLHGLIEEAQDKDAGRLEARIAPLVASLGPERGNTPADGIQKLATRIARRSLKGPSLDASYPAPQIKAALKLQGHPIRPDVRPPFETLKKPQVDKLRAVLQRAGLLS